MPNSSRTLEEALVQVKIDKALANSSVAELHAKLVAISNRYNRLLSQIPEEDKRLEVVPALTLCEEVLELFRDRSHVFWKNPLVSAPFLVTFAGIYTSIAELSLILIPSYWRPLNKQILILQDALVAFKLSCIQTRDTSIKIKAHIPDSIMEGALSGGEESYYVDDKHMNLNNLNNNNNPIKVHPPGDVLAEPGKFQSFEDQKEAIQTYKKILVEKYNSFFEHVLESVRSFSGFKYKDHSPPRKLHEDDDKTNLEKVHGLD